MDDSAKSEDETGRPIGTRSKDEPAGEPPRSEWRETLSFLLKLAIAVFVIRSFLIAPFVIPSESMLPRLLVGDYLFITKWNYGYSRYSLPWNLPLIPGRILASTPHRGDVVVFKKPPEHDEDWIKRVIGLPGDTIQVRGGQVILNGKPIPKQRIADFTEKESANTHCNPPFEDTAKDGTAICRYPQYLETLPGGKTYRVLDMGQSIADDTQLFTVPAGHVFLMGDNRDNSEDSRFPQTVGGGIGYVPIKDLEGKAVVNFWSSDGNASWLLPWTWFTAARWDRIGKTF